MSRDEEDHASSDASAGMATHETTATGSPVAARAIHSDVKSSTVHVRTNVRKIVRSAAGTNVHQERNCNANRHPQTNAIQATAV